MELPTDLKYAETHEWAREDGDTVTVGITDFAQDQLGDVVFVELPELGIVVEAGVQVAVVESVKTASDIYSPYAGEIIEVNTELDDSPELINAEPYGEGWLFKIRIDGAQDADLLSAAEYTARIEAGD